MSSINSSDSEDYEHYNFQVNYSKNDFNDDLLKKHFSKKTNIKSNEYSEIKIFNKPSEKSKQLPTNNEKIISEISKLKANNNNQNISQFERIKLEENLVNKYGKGYKLLKLSGYKIGSGLGINEQGITDPIEVKMKMNKGGINPNDEHLNPLNNDEKNNYLLGKKRINLNEKVQKLNKEFEGFEELINNYKNNNKDEKLLKIIENYKRQFKKKRKKNKFNELINRTINYKLLKNFDVETNKKIITNLIFLTKNKILEYINNSYNNINNKIINNKLSINTIEEIDKYSNKINTEEIFINKIKNILYENIEYNNLQIINEYIIKFINLFNSNKYLYKNKYNTLTIFCMHNCIKYINDLKLNIEQYLSKEISSNLIKIYYNIKKLINNVYNEEYNNEKKNDGLFKYSKFSDENNKSNKFYNLFLYETLLNKMEILIIKEWNIKDYNIILLFFNIYDEIISKFCKAFLSDLITNQILLFLKSEYEFLPKNKESLFINKWIHPLYEILIYKNIEDINIYVENQIKENILSWNLENLEEFNYLIDLLIPWKKIFNKNFWIEIKEKFFIPKIKYLINIFEINNNNNDVNFNIIYIIEILDKFEIINNEESIKLLNLLFQKIMVEINKNNNIQKIELIYNKLKEQISYFLNNSVIKNLLKNILILIYKLKKTT